MSNLIDLNVPDIGDVAEVEVIEVMISPGDSIKLEQGLVTLESDKASMEIPASQAGVVAEVLVKVGDRVSEGATIARISVEENASANTISKSAPAPVAAPQAAAASSNTEASDLTCDVLVLGAGPGGYSAAFRAADLGLNVILVERYSTLGGVCLNVGCIPSKALLNTVGVFEAAKALKDQGISFGEAEINIDALRQHKEGVVSKLTAGLAGMAKARKVNVITGTGKFINNQQVQVTTQSDGIKTISFSSAIIAAGSESIKLPFLPDDPRIIDSTGALKLASIPKSMLVVGGGIIGLEMATVYSALGTRIDVVEMQDGLMQGTDTDMVKVWEKFNAHRFDRVMLNTKTVSAKATNEGIQVSFEGTNAPEPITYELVLQAVGRRPNGKAIGAENAGVNVSENGFIPVDNQMRTNVPNIYAIGDIVGQPMLAHKAVHEAHIAAEVIAGQKSYFDARVIPSVAYTNPEIAWVGLTESEAKKQGIEYKKGLFPWAASGRAIANTRDEGFTKLLFDANTNHIIGGSIVGTNAGDMIGEIALAIEMGADNVDIARTIHPHPTLGESIGMAAAAADGACTDLPPVRKRK